MQTRMARSKMAALDRNPLLFLPPKRRRATPCHKTKRRKVTFAGVIAEVRTFQPYLKKLESKQPYLKKMSERGSKQPSSLVVVPLATPHARQGRGELLQKMATK